MKVLVGVDVAGGRARSLASDLALIVKEFPGNDEFEIALRLRDGEERTIAAAARVDASNPDLRRELVALLGPSTVWAVLP